MAASCARSSHPASQMATPAWVHPCTALQYRYPLAGYTELDAACPHAQQSLVRNLAALPQVAPTINHQGHKRDYNPGFLCKHPHFSAGPCTFTYSREPPCQLKGLLQLGTAIKGPTQQDVQNRQPTLAAVREILSGPKEPCQHFRDKPGLQFDISWQLNHSVQHLNVSGVPFLYGMTSPAWPAAKGESEGSVTKLTVNGIRTEAPYTSEEAATAAVTEQNTDLLPEAEVAIY